jgi:hypothetical protein
VIHQNTEIVAQERARDTERPGRGHDESLPEGEERGGDERIERGREEARTGLFQECPQVSVGGCTVFEWVQ